MPNRRILIVDDNVDIHADFRKILSPKNEPKDAELESLEDQLFGAGGASLSNPETNWSYEIDSAYQGQEALQKTEEAAHDNKPYALIFMDVRMPPGWDGIETIKRIWEKHPYTEIVLCTAYSDYTNSDIISTLGVSHRLLFLKKPFDAVAVKQMALAITTKWSFEAESRIHVYKLERAVQDRTQELERSIKNLTDTNAELDVSLKQLTETQSLLVQASKMSALGEMAGGIAHEINTPLGTVFLLVGELQAANDQGVIDQERFAKSLTTIETTINRISKIITGLRSFSRDGTNDDLQKVNVKDLIHDTLALCTEKLKNHGIEVRLNEEQISLDIECRAIQISQVLLNLFNNAYDAVENLSEKWIQIDVKEHKNHIEISVIDSGSGIPSAVQEKIFQPFFTTKDIGKGTGLGLSISKGILTAHKGKMILEPKSKNTQFVVHLPKRQN